jgi:hypothetical protein
MGWTSFGIWFHVMVEYTTGSKCGGENLTAPLNFTHQALVLFHGIG